MAANDTERFERLKNILLEKKRKMWNDLREEFFDKLGKEYSTQFDNPHDMMDLSIIDVIEDTGIAIADIRLRELVQTDVAISSLEEGSYGVCSGCGLEIDEERLNVMPFATRCVTCKSKSESE